MFWSFTSISLPGTVPHSKSWCNHFLESPACSGGCSWRSMARHRGPWGSSCRVVPWILAQLTIFSGRETLQPFRMLHPPKKNEREIRPPKKGTHISIGKCILKTIIFSGDIMLVFRGGKRKRFFLVAGKQFWKESPFFWDFQLQMVQIGRFSHLDVWLWFGTTKCIQVFCFAGRRACQGWIFLDYLAGKNNTLPKTKMAAENMPKPKSKLVFQAPFFKGLN